MILSIIRLNHEVREIIDKMTTKDDIKMLKDDIKNMATKDDVKMLKWFISIGFTIIGILIAVIGILK